MYCSNCGHQIDEGQKFCANCGKEILYDKKVDVHSAPPINEASRVEGKDFMEVEIVPLVGIAGIALGTWNDCHSNWSGGLHDIRMSLCGLLSRIP